MIIANAPDIRVEIVAFGDPLEEYDDPDTPDSHTTATRYVESLEDATSKIRCSVEDHPFRLGRDLSIDFEVDGIYMEGTLHGSDEGNTCISEGPHISVDRIKQYKFGVLKIEDGAKIGEQKAAEDIGCITVAVGEATGGPRKPYNAWQEIDIASSISRKQAAKQSLTHFNEFGMSKHVPAPKHVYASLGYKHLATYKFLYRSRADLRSLRIIQFETQPMDSRDNPIVLPTAWETDSQRPVTPESEGPPTDAEHEEPAAEQRAKTTLAIREKIKDLTGDN